MAYPLTGVSAAHCDSASDVGDPALFRSDVHDLIFKFNDLRTELYRVSGGRFDWNSVGAMAAVVGMLGWTKFGDNHAIYDASSGQTPEGVPLGTGGDINTQIAWSQGSPVLMGWNGYNTYGVRVDSARVADIAAQSADSIGNGQSWQNPGKAIGALYTNSSSRPIAVFVSFYSQFTIPSTVSFYVDGMLAAGATASPSSTATLFSIVPPGKQYYVVHVLGDPPALASWLELKV